MQLPVFWGPLQRHMGVGNRADETVGRSFGPQAFRGNRNQRKARRNNIVLLKFHFGISRTLRKHTSTLQARRGVLSLAAAVSLPYVLPDGRMFPQRSMIIYLAFCLIMTTLVVPGVDAAMADSAARVVGTGSH